ncbi:MAG: sortase [Clostridia bacterium]|nr:sortase [Clostridia bacterium]
MNTKRFRKGKHRGQKENKKFSSRQIKFFSLILIVIILLFGISKFIKESDFIGTTEEKNSPQTQVVDINNIPDKMGGYKVLGVLVIDKLGLEKNILEETTDASLNLSVTKFYGPNLNEIGNFCITGHNYKDIFECANDLALEDTFYVIDKANREKVTYKIYDKYTVNPTELDCLSQETQGKREITLITCNPGGITRLIVKAREV